MLTPSKEVAVFIDDNQFGSGESVDKCGPEALALFWHSVKPGETNKYKAADVHKQAHDLYERFIGPDARNDTAGTDDATLYKMIEFLGFKYFKGPLEWTWVRSWLNNGYPVIIGGINESAVKDTALSGLKNPYNWNTSGLFHIILATGPETPGYIRVRDTANIASTGVVRPGPRVYETTGLTFTTSTMVVPSWLPVPKSGTPPTPEKSWQQEAFDQLSALEALLKAHL